MTLQEFARDWIPILQLIVSTIGLGSLVLVWWQLRQTSRWNKLRMSYMFLGPATQETLRHFTREAKRAGVNIKSDSPLTDAEVQLIWDDDEVLQAFKDATNDMESLCAQIRLGAVDPDVAFTLHSARVTRFWHLYWPMIERLRRKYNDDDLVNEVQCVAEDWKDRREAERMLKEQQRRKKIQQKV
ncbi:MAG TPA: hypothetical protein VLC46_01825 [Thermoanaerobaculia bacterium]|jgi:hypothetical protein|nr:hypothetical protein [Thermoanaerobaculia bacterium]